MKLTARKEVKNEEIKRQQNEAKAATQSLFTNDKTPTEGSVHSTPQPERTHYKPTNTLPLKMTAEEPVKTQVGQAVKAAKSELVSHQKRISNLRRAQDDLSAEVHRLACENPLAKVVHQIGFQITMAEHQGQLEWAGQARAALSDIQATTITPSLVTDTPFAESRGNYLMPAVEYESVTDISMARGEKPQGE